LKDVTINNQNTILNKPLENQEVYYDYFQREFTINELSNFKFIDTFNDFKTQFQQNSKNEIGLEVNGVYISFPAPIQYHYKDVAKGEIYKPFHIVPAVSVKFSQPTYIASNQNQKIEIILDNYSDVNTAGVLSVIDSENKEIFKNHISLNPKKKNISLYVPKNIKMNIYTAHFKQDKHIFNNQIKWVDYSHIPLNYYYKPDETKIVSFNKSVLKKSKIWYIVGAGDEIPQVLKDVGYNVDFINLETVKAE